MLQTIGLFVHPIPWIPQRGDEQQFKQSVSSNHVDCQAPTAISEIDAMIPPVYDQATVVQTFRHVCDGRAGDPQRVRKVLGGSGTTGFMQPKENAHVVLNCRRRNQRMLGSHAATSSAVAYITAMPADTPPRIGHVNAGSPRLV